MSDLISRQAAIDAVDDVPYIKEHPNEGLLWKAWIEQMPSAQPELSLEQVLEYCRSRCITVVEDEVLYKRLDSAYAEGYTYAESKYRKMWDEMQANIKEKAFGKRKGLVHTADIDAMPTIEPERPSGREVYQAGYAEGYKAGQEERKKMSNKEWVDFLSEQFTVSRTSAREMLHGLMRWKAEDNFKKQFSGGRNEKE